LRRLIRTIKRAGQDSDVWPVVLLLFAVLVPAVCLLWFMSAAMRNERFAARERVAEAYRNQLSATQKSFANYWETTLAGLERIAEINSPAEAFAWCVLGTTSGVVDSVVIFDEQGRVAYPNTPLGSGTESHKSEAKWTAASQFEFLRKDFTEAAGQYHALAQETTNINVAARALQAEARCLVQAGKKDAAVELVNEILGATRFDHATDPQVGSLRRTPN
jgi:hypothetical protein